MQQLSCTEWGLYRGGALKKLEVEGKGTKVPGGNRCWNSEAGLGREWSIVNWPFTGTASNITPALQAIVLFTAHHYWDYTLC
jgi:hypothetical protein